MNCMYRTLLVTVALACSSVAASVATSTVYAGVLGAGISGGVMFEPAELCSVIFVGGPSL